MEIRGIHGDNYRGKLKKIEKIVKMNHKTI